mmetsp:Transcript_14550/g.32037  ORF Transcript_14550/g.32037 Transcript_14550/m.32037 type:complete len:132 (+) Transcript_14550:22-417(+)
MLQIYQKLTKVQQYYKNIKINFVAKTHINPKKSKSRTKLPFLKLPKLSEIYSIEMVSISSRSSQETKDGSVIRFDNCLMCSSSCDLGMTLIPDCKAQDSTTSASDRSYFSAIFLTTASVRTGFSPSSLNSC